MPADSPRGSFGSRRAAERDQQDPVGPLPTPVLHVGEVHAELRLHVTEDTLAELGSQIASVLATAVREGFTAGMQAGMAEVEAQDEPEPEPARAGRAVSTLTPEDLRRARGE